MDDKRIEKLLKDSWDVNTPDGMRGRVLDRARSRPAFSFGLPKWQTAFAVAGLVIVLAAGASEHAREARLSRMADSRPASQAAPLIRDREWMKQRRELSRLLAQAGTDITPDAAAKGEDSL